MTKTADVLNAAEQVVTMDRRGNDRRNGNSEATTKATEPTQRRKQQRRRQIDPTTCERDYSGDEIEFMQAMDAYKRSAGRMFPTCSEILEVVRSLGYVRLTSEQMEQLNVSNEVAEDEDYDYNAEEEEEFEDEVE